MPLLLDMASAAAQTSSKRSRSAHAVLIGRPYAYALAVAGEQGVRETIENSRRLRTDARPAGCLSVAEVGPQSLAPAE